MFNVTDYILAPPGQVGCDCAEMDVNDTTSNAWGWDNRLGRDCEKVPGCDAMTTDRLDWDIRWYDGTLSFQYVVNQRSWNKIAFLVCFGWQP